MCGWSSGFLVDFFCFWSIFSPIILSLVFAIETAFSVE